MPKLSLHTLPFSHFCEAARWSLREARVPFVEKVYLPGLHRIVPRREDGAHSMPVLMRDPKGLSQPAVVEAGDTWACLRKLDDDIPAELQLVLDETIGPCSRTVAYSHLLRGKYDRMRNLISSPLFPWWQRLIFMAPTVKERVFKTMRKKMVRRGEHVALCKQRIRHSFGVLEPIVRDARFGLRPADGGPSASGIAMASLFAPLVLPPQYATHFFGATLPELDYEAVPKGHRHEADTWRATPIGQWTLDFYERHYYNAPPRIEPTDDD